MFIIPAGGADTQYRVARSLRFYSPTTLDITYLTRTPGSPSNRDVMTFHCWLKRTPLGAQPAIFSAGTSSVSCSQITLAASGALILLTHVGGVPNFQRASNETAFNDPTVWVALTVSIDTTTSTYRAWAGATELTWAGGSSITPAAGTDMWFNDSTPHLFGRLSSTGFSSFSGYLAHIHFIDGLALTYTSFLDGAGQPKLYTGAYGTNGFKLDFADNSAATAAALGKDTSGNGNNFTPSGTPGHSVAAGSENDCMVDSPTEYGTDTGVGGEVRGNYCIWNAPPIYGNPAVNGALDTAASSVYRGTMPLLAFNAYWEITHIAGSSLTALGVCDAGGTATRDVTLALSGKTYGFRMSTAGALDYKNITDAGAWTSIVTGLTGAWYPYASCNGPFVALNAGQRPFAATAPAGYKALCSTNAP